MKLFIKEITILFLFTFLTGELICQLFPIVSDIPIKGNRDGFYSLKENQSGTYIRGKLPRWLNAEYSINNDGFNSSKDYFFDTNLKSKIALLGDSFVEGFQVDVTESIGRLVEDLKLNYEVYEFGISGFNFYDYQELYQKYNLQNFKKVFIILDRNDILTTKSDKKVFTKTIELKEKIFRKIYNRALFFKYLNFNHGIIREIQTIYRTFNSINSTLDFSNKKQTPPLDINQFIKSNHNIELILKSKKDTLLKSFYPDLDFININEDLRPIDFGFDKHWNLNGRKNVANTIVKRLSK